MIRERHAHKSFGYPKIERICEKARNEYLRHAARYPDLNLEGSDGFPFPGHIRIFLSALEEAVRAAGKVRPLSSFHVVHYRTGEMGIGFAFEDEPVMSRIPWEDRMFRRIAAIAQKAGKLSSTTCVMCGERASQSDRFKPHGTPVAICDTYSESEIVALVEW